MIDTKKFVIKEETYSKDVLGYRIVICDKPHYILNGSLNLIQKFRILIRLKQLRKVHQGNGFILIHNDYQVHIAPENHYETTSERDAI